MNNESKFNGKSIVYSKYRPDYPEQLVIDLIIENKLNKNSLIADIGSGTGIFTKKLLDFSLNVYAVEPNEVMRNVAEDKLQEYKCFTSVEGSAENTTLLDSSVDFITVAQAFHWFDLENFQRECQRIQKNVGKVAIISNERITETSINKEIADTYQRFCPNFNGFSNGTLAFQDVYDAFFKENYSVKTYNNPLLYSKENFIGRHLSSSFSLTKDEELYPMLVESLSGIFEKYSKNGYLTLPNITKCRCGFVNNSDFK
ncbi:MAG: class I SAM-dependent methyltransferase [Bacillus sp. (in: firmicutes)]